MIRQLSLPSLLADVEVQREAKVRRGHGHGAHPHPPPHLPLLAARGSRVHLPRLRLRHPLQPLDDVLAVDAAPGGDPDVHKVGAELAVVVGSKRRPAVQVDQVGQPLGPLVVLAESGDLVGM